MYAENASAGVASKGQFEDEKSGGAGPPLTGNAEAAKCETDTSLSCEAVKLWLCNIHHRFYLWFHYSFSMPM